MKILEINKFYYRKGGSETHFFDLIDLLKSKGHDVAVFSMEDEKNLDSNYSKYFVSNIDFNKKGSILKKAERVLFGKEAKLKLEELIKDFKPDVAHLHNISGQISPAIIDVLKAHNIKVVMTLHDWKIICPNYKLFNKGSVCEQCKGGKYYNAVKNECVKNSYMESAGAAIEAYLYNNKIHKDVDLFIAPSDFMRKKMIEWGVDKNKIVCLSNFIGSLSCDKDFGSDYIVYAGRLSEEKGVLDLVRAVKGLPVELKLAGSGPMENKIRKYINDEGLDNVQMLGKLDKKEVMELICGAKFTVLPSVWYENCPMSILESFALGKPVIASSLGGNNDLVTDNFTGLLFEVGNVDKLREKIEYLYNNEDVLDKMSENCKRIVRLNDRELYYKKLVREL